MGWFAFILLAPLLTTVKIEGKYEPKFHVPFACSIVYDYGIPSRRPVLVGSGTILTASVIITSVDNLNEPIAPNSGDLFYQNVNKLNVHAGSNFMDPSRAPFKVKGNQSRKAEALYVPYKPSFDDPNRLFCKNPQNLSREHGTYEYDVYGFAFNVGFLEIEIFHFTPFVSPAIIPGTKLSDLQRIIREEIAYQESQVMPTTLCFTYSYNEYFNQMRYLEMTYLPKNNCVDMYCWYRVTECKNFPKLEHLMCYKSTKLIDACPEARGAALYCHSSNEGVLSILTFAPLCGLARTPGVYSNIALVVEFYEKVFNKSVLPYTLRPLSAIAEEQRRARNE